MLVKCTLKSAFVSERRNICQHSLNMQVVSYQGATVFAKPEITVWRVLEACERLETFPFRKASVPPANKHWGGLIVRAQVAKTVQ